MGRVDYIAHANTASTAATSIPSIREPPFRGEQDLVRSTGGREFFNQSVGVQRHLQLSARRSSTASIFRSPTTKVLAISGAPFSLKSIGVNIASPTPPEINIQIAGYFSISTGAPGEFIRDSFHFADSVHWIKGKHEIAFGGDFLRMKVDLNNSYRQAGRFRFRGPSYSGDARSDFHARHYRTLHPGRRRIRGSPGNLGSLFAQDNIRVSRQLNVNIGVRWDPFLPYTDELGRTECFVPGKQSQRFPNAPTGYLFAGDSACPDGRQQEPIGHCFRPASASPIT